ncbi:hypothetical protein V8E36_005265 [Tilletia maclaganii]
MDRPSLALLHRTCSIRPDRTSRRREQSPRQRQLRRHTLPIRSHASSGSSLVAAATPASTVHSLISAATPAPVISTPSQFPHASSPLWPRQPQRLPFLLQPPPPARHGRPTGPCLDGYANRRTDNLHSARHRSRAAQPPHSSLTSTSQSQPHISHGGSTRSRRTQLSFSRHRSKMRSLPSPPSLANHHLHTSRQPLPCQATRATPSAIHSPAALLRSIHTAAAYRCTNFADTTSFLLTTSKLPRAPPARLWLQHQAVRCARFAMRG